MGKAIQGMDFICDIDGTLMNIDHRRHFVEGDKKDWKSFEDNINNQADSDFYFSYPIISNF